MPIGSKEIFSFDKGERVVNAEKARKIVEQGKIEGYPTPIADGYLAALEGPEVKALVQTVELFAVAPTKLQVSEEVKQIAKNAYSAFTKAVKP